MVTFSLGLLSRSLALCVERRRRRALRQQQLDDVLVTLAGCRVQKGPAAEHAVRTHGRRGDGTRLEERRKIGGRASHRKIECLSHNVWRWCRPDVVRNGTGTAALAATASATTFATLRHRVEWR